MKPADRSDLLHGVYAKAKRALFTVRGREGGGIIETREGAVRRTLEYLARRIKSSGCRTRSDRSS